MKIVYIFREKRDTPPSIENVFHNLGDSMLERGHIVEYYTLPNKNRLIQTLNVLKFKKDSKADIFHVTGDIHWVSLLLPRKKTLLTIHDFSSFDNNNFSKNELVKFIYKIFWFKLPILYLKRIHLISNNVFKNGSNYFPNLIKKGVVIYNIALTSVKMKNEVKKEKIVILQVGTHVNKNLNLLLDVAKTLKDNLNFQLNIIGKLNAEHIKKLNSEDIDFKNSYDLSNKQMYCEFRKSDILFFASFYEGFGLPIIEAQSMGIPVITSNIPITNEVAGNAALFINPLSIDEAFNAILKLSNPQIQKEMVDLGLQNVKRFSKEIITQQFETLYKEII
jgi:glycosyltransferase involved in cell wall biosynthesis